MLFNVIQVLTLRKQRFAKKETRCSATGHELSRVVLSVALNSSDALFLCILLWMGKVIVLVRKNVYTTN